MKMKKALWYSVVLFLFIVHLASPVFAQESLRDALDRRYHSWVGRGADPERLDAALRRAQTPIGDGPGSLVHEVSIEAKIFWDTAVSLEAQGKKEEAGAAYKTASILYGVARFPFISSASAASAYERHLAAYLKTHELIGPPLEVVNIPFEDKTIVGYLSMPDRPVATPVPVVVVTGGIDTWKAEVDRTVEAMTNEGMAAFAFDMPGTGESGWVLEANAERVYSKVLDYLKSREDIDGSRMGVNGRSFAGYFAVKLVLTDPDCKAAVNFGGPLVHAFTFEHLSSITPMMPITVAQGFGIDLEMPLDEKVEQFSVLSLERQGLLKAPARQGALLTINGDDDDLVPIEDAYAISKAGIKQELWIYPNGGHTASAFSDENIPGAARWLREELMKD
jgi:esterase FrsA